MSRRIKRRGLLPKPPMPTYLTLNEIRASGKAVDPDLVAPADKQRICANAMGAMDDLDVAIQRAIKDSADNPIVYYDFGNGNVAVDFVTLAVNLIDKGKTVEHVVSEIKRLDAFAVEHQRKQGVYAPASKA